MKFAKPHKHKTGHRWTLNDYGLGWKLQALDKAGACRRWDDRLNIHQKCPLWTWLQIKDIPF